MLSDSVFRVYNGGFLQEIGNGGSASFWYVYKFWNSIGNSIVFPFFSYLPCPLDFIAAVTPSVKFNNALDFICCGV